jgi:hypothetical protein
MALRQIAETKKQEPGKQIPETSRENKYLLSYRGKRGGGYREISAGVAME